ncbi:MAG TPA: DUF1289 domain-containing protein [Steroidobacteraceae bacterium]
MNEPRVQVEPASPCTGVCRLDQRQVCVGCGRSAEEIGEWLGASAMRKDEICAAALRRRQAAAVIDGTSSGA